MVFPADPMRGRRVDEHFAEESAAARQAGHDIGLIDLERLNDGDVVGAVAGVRRAGRDVVYRGWMLSASRYTRLFDALAERGVVLRTDPAHYRLGHELPGWYEPFRQLTPESYWTTGDEPTELDRARLRLGDGPAVVRDWVKSAKHEWFSATFIPDVADADQTWAVASRLRVIRDDEFTGGFVLRRFENFMGPETRTWWLHGRCVATTAHPDTPSAVPPVAGGVAHELIAPAVNALGLPFVTVDLVQDAGARWRVVEVGDGQVSDRPGTADAGQFIAAIAPTA